MRRLLAVADDFAVPGAAFVGRSYGSVALGPDLIRSILIRGGIEQIFLPAYSPGLETGNARAGFAVFFRSSELGRAIRKGGFPLDLLRPFPLADRASQRRIRAPLMARSPDLRR